jgi:hypothetical protein
MPEYKVMEIVGARLDGQPLYKSTRWPSQVGDEHFTFCGHQHPSIEDAATCREFDSEE